MARLETIKHQEHCGECGIKMRPVAFKRPYAKMCPDCRGEMSTGNTELRQMYKDMQKNPTIPSLDEIDFSSQNVICNDTAIWRRPKFE